MTSLLSARPFSNDRMVGDNQAPSAFGTGGMRGPQVVIMVTLSKGELARMVCELQAWQKASVGTVVLEVTLNHRHRVRIPQVKNGTKSKILIVLGRYQAKQRGGQRPAHLIQIVSAGVRMPGHSSPC